MASKGLGFCGNGGGSGSLGFVLHLSSPQPPSKGEPGSGGLGLVHFFDRRSVSAFWTVESPGAEQSPFEGGWGMTCKASPFISCGNLCKLDLQIFEKQHIKCKKINVLFCLPAIALAKAGARHSLGVGSLSPITNHQSPITNHNLQYSIPSSIPSYIAFKSTRIGFLPMMDLKNALS